MDDIIKEFLDSVRQQCETVKKELKYSPNRIIGIVYDYSTTDEFKMAKIKGLIRKESTEGLIRMWELGGQDGLKLTIEYLALNDKYRPIFTEEEICICREKLRSFGLNV